MGYEVHFNDGSPESIDWVFAFGSATDLDEIRKWVKSKLPVKFFPRLHELVDTMTTKDTLELGSELDTALDVKPPPASVRPIIDDFMENMGLGDEEETVTIGDDFPQSKADREACESAMRAGRIAARQGDD
jgi:hypothetical protein